MSRTPVHFCSSGSFPPSAARTAASSRNRPITYINPINAVFNLYQIPRTVLISTPSRTFLLRKQHIQHRARPRWIRDSVSNLTGFRTLITFSSHVRTMNRAVLGAGHGLTVTLEIRHSVIPGGFVRACARREHPPSSANHFPATIISGCHDRPARAFLLRIPSSFNSSTRRFS